MEKLENNQIFENITINQVYEKAALSLKEDLVDPEEFKDLYGEYNINYDKDYVKKMEEKFNQEDTQEQIKSNKLATILEAILHDQAELNEWLGPNVYTINTSRYDDIKNGVDIVAEFIEKKHSASYLGLAIDATFSTNINNKIQRIKNEIKKGDLAKIKYFKSNRMNFRGELSKIPRVIIGANANTIQKLGELWFKRKNKEIEQHPIQFQILDQILIQLETFEKYAEQNNRPEIVKIYQKTHKIIMKIYEEKESSINDSGIRDSMFEKIKKAMDNFNG